jgi:hypothetical protein
MLTPFEQMIADAIGSEPTEHTQRVIAGVSADPAWRDLTFLTPALASGTLATQLAARAVAISNALKTAETRQAPATPQERPIHERFEMSAEEFRKLPPHKKRELREEAAKHDAREEAGPDVAALKVKQAAGTLSLVEKLTLARLENPGPTRAQRKDPLWVQSQQTHASVETLERLKRGHDQIWPSGNYPEVLRSHHKAESERLAALIEAKKQAENV